jgi:hypothetical protein
LVGFDTYVLDELREPNAKERDHKSKQQQQQNEKKHRKPTKPLNLPQKQSIPPSI